MNPTRLDHTMIEWLEYYEIPFAVILTKSDKISRQKIHLRKMTVKEITRELRKCIDVLTYSSVTGEGKSSLVSLINATIAHSRQ
jgi:GTP-binding protein